MAFISQYGPGGRASGNIPGPAGGGMGRDEKAALRRAEEAERAFRASKGYEKATLWSRLKHRLFWKRGRTHELER